MRHIGQLVEISHDYQTPIQYFLHIENEKIYLNPHIGSKITIKFLDEKHCIHCGRKTNKTFNNGYCYPCFRDLPQNDLCIVKPSLCHFELGTCRDEEFGKHQCMTPHYVYLALSSDVKVGLTRKTNAFKRWVDQGAIKSIPIAELPTRKMAGDLELFLTDHLPDKTNWRKMLKGEVDDKDLFEIRARIFPLIPEEYQEYLLDVEQINEFIYPTEAASLEKIKSLSLDKEPSFTGVLTGIKGQYLLLDQAVINVKKHLGYKIEFVLE